MSADLNSVCYKSASCWQSPRGRSSVFRGDLGRCSGFCASLSIFSSYDWTNGVFH